jgi:hypothetical protein
MTGNGVNRITGLVVGAALLLLLAVFAVIQAWDRRPETATDPRLLAMVDLATGPFDEVVVARFTLAETRVVQLRYSLINLDSPAFDLSLQGAERARFTILHAEQYRTSEDGGGDWQQTLPPDDYRLVLTAAQSPGTLAIYANDAPGAP